MVGWLVCWLLLKERRSRIWKCTSKGGSRHREKIIKSCWWWGGPLLPLPQLPLTPPPPVAWAVVLAVVVVMVVNQKIGVAISNSFYVVFLPNRCPQTKFQLLCPSSNISPSRDAVDDWFQHTLDVLEGLRMVLRSFQVHLRGSGIDRKHIRQQICPVSWEQYCWRFFGLNWGFTALVAKWFWRIFEPPVQSRWSRNPPNNIKVTSKERSEKLGHKSSL